MLQRTAPLIVSALVLLATSPAFAQNSALSHLERRHEAVNRILRTAAETEAARRRRSQRLTRLLNELLDYETLSARALSDHWESRSEEDRARFVEMLRQLVERNYEQNLERILDFEISYEDETQNEDETVVTTSARSRTQRRQPPVEIQYRLVEREGEWRVVDVTTDGVSMVENYRSKFNRIIQRDGWDELIERMERRLAAGDDA